MGAYTNVFLRGLHRRVLQRIARPQVVRIHAVATFQLVHTVSRRHVREGLVETETRVREGLTHVMRRLRAAFHRAQGSTLTQTILVTFRQSFFIIISKSIN